MLHPEITFFAKTNFRNREVPFGIKSDDRRRHMYVIGKTGMGKTTLMENMVIQDIHNGHGVCFIDPHGDSVAKILDFIPNNRINDVIYFNPADLEFPVSFNILEAVDTKYKHLVASGLMGVFTKIWANLWSARMEYILNNTILALLDSPGNTMLGIARMYIDKKYRKKIVDNIKDPMVRAFWVDEFANYNEKYRTEAIAPIQNKVGQFLSSAIVRNIVGQPRSTIDLRDIMDNQKILLLDLSKGKVGEDNSALLGAMIITKLQLAALSRVDVPEAERKDFYLYVDEFQNFVTDSFATILSEARKYRLNLTIGHQYMGQLMPDRNNTKVRDAVFGNVGTMVVFRVGSADAEYLETEFDPVFTPNDIVNLPKAHVILKLMINGVASEPFSAVTLPPISDGFAGNHEKVVRVSRERYANPVVEVEEKISRWMGAEFHEQTAEVENTETEKRTPAPQKKFNEAPLMTTSGPVEQSTTVTESIVETAPHIQIPAQKEEARIVMSTQAVESMNTPVPPPREPRPNPAGNAPRAFPSKNAPQQGARPSRTEEYRPPGPRPQRNFTPRPQNGQGAHNKSTYAQRPKPRKPDTKRDNPIWNAASELNTEKSALLAEEVATAIGSAFTPTNSVQQKPSQKTPPEQSDPQATVVQPGEVHKF